MSATMEPTARTSAAGPERSDPPVLRLSGITKRWPKAPAAVLDALDLSVARGETIAISGRNGAGKTTLLRVAAGLIRPESGTAEVQGLDLEQHRTICQRRLGFVSAGNSGLYGRLDVEHHLQYWARMALLPAARRRAAIEATIDRFALAELCGRRVDRLSMGQRQRLRLALAFLHEPDLVLLDEPRTSLDAEGVEVLARAVREVTDAGGAAVVCLPEGDPDPVPFDRRFHVAHGKAVAA
jgi:ABC-type multidrug transport system ATPase subunit